MDLYQDLVRLQVRKNKKQKTEFIEYVRSIADEKGIPFAVEESGSMPKTRNIVLGDLSKADAVFAAHYDTCAVMPVPNLLTPKNFWAFLGWQLIMTVFLVGIPLAVAYGFIAAGMARETALLFYLALLYVMLGLMMAGPANRHTMNDNTSGVYTVLTAALNGNPDSRAAYVLFDNEELGLMGSAAFAKAHSRIKKDVPVINFDCVGDGDNMLIFPRKKAKDHPAYGAYLDCLSDAPFSVVPADSGFSVYPSDQKKFDLGIGVASFHKNKTVGYWMGRIHTKCDTVLNREQADFLARSINRYTEKL